jgi:hypothetical protein
LCPLAAVLAIEAAIPLLTQVSLQVLPRLLTTMPDPICALAAHCLYQWPADARAALMAEFQKASRGRSLYFITIDHPAALDSSRIAESVAYVGDDAPLEHESTLTVFRDENATATLLGRYDSFGRRGVWLADSSAQR